jgi:hypothetical protein
VNWTSLLGRYTQLLSLNRRLFLERFKIDAPLIFIGLVYVFVGRTRIELTVGKGVFLLIGFVFAAVMESQIIQRNTARLSFYLKLPIHKKMTLALFYTSIILPNLIIFSLLYLLLRAITPAADAPWLSTLMVQRYFQVIFAFLFIKSLTINIMIAMNIHLALIAGYFLLLGFILLALSILRELVMPLVIINSTAFVFLFLLSTYLVSFIAVKKIGLR